METNKNNIEKIIITIPSPQASAESINEIEEVEAIEIELQDTESMAKNSLVIVSENPKGKQKSIDLKQVFQSLVHAFRWSQLKRQLNKEALVAISQRQGKKVAMAAGAFAIYCSVGISTNDSSPQNADESYVQATASFASLVRGGEESSIVVSESVAENYIARFSEVARGEMKNYGIPASIILALAIANSNYGTSNLAQGGNNHFHITCHTNHLAEGLVGQQQEDDKCYSHYENAWTSFRANSMLLTSESLSELRAVAKKDYQIWASGLEKMHYPNAKKIIPLIEKHELFDFDKK